MIEHLHNMFGRRKGSKRGKNIGLKRRESKRDGEDSNFPSSCLVDWE